MQDYVGKQIDRYRITERLGMGGMAVVYKAYDTRLERDVALKLIRVDEIPPSQHERLMKRFEREAKAMAKFSHPNIVAVHDYGEVDGSPYLVIEYIPGGTLKDKTGQPIPVETAIGWITPIADALAYAHEFGIIHRDVKPSNILFDQKGRPILTDFGIAKILETDEATLTGTGMGVGTPEYMAPEQWQGKTSAATDQYALGVVLYELITGKKPYSADTPAAIAILQATEPLPRPSAMVPKIPDIVEKVLYKALARDPRDRYQSMAIFHKALVKLEQGSFLEIGEESEKSEKEIFEIRREVITPDQYSDNSLSASENEKIGGSKKQEFASDDELVEEGRTVDEIELGHQTNDRLSKIANKGQVKNQQIGEKKIQSAFNKKKIGLGVSSAVIIVFIIAVICLAVLVKRIVNYSNKSTSSSSSYNSINRTATLEVQKTATAKSALTATAKAAKTATAKARMTATADAIEIILSTATSGFDELSLGLNGVSEECLVNNEVNQISQKEIFMEEPIYISSHFNDSLSNETINIAVRDKDGELVFERLDWDLSNEENNCFWWPINLDPHTKSGLYSVEVSLHGIVILDKTFQITPYDISSIERPSRDPFGNFTFGRGGVNSNICEVDYQTTIVSLEDVQDDPWFYFASPYKIDEIGKSFTWTIYSPTGDVIHSVVRHTEDTYDLCMWQGFYLEGEPVGDYRLTIELDDGSQIEYEFTIE